MKIVLSSRESIYGGGERFLIQLAEHLHGQGHEIEMRVPVDSALMKRGEQFPRVARLCPRPSSKIVANDFRSLWQSILIDGFARRCLVLHGPWQLSRLRLLIARISRAKLAVVSLDLANEICRLEGRETVDIPVLPLGPPNRQRQVKRERGPAHKKIRMVSIARLDKVKRLPIYASVVQALESRGIPVEASLLFPEPQNIEQTRILSNLGKRVERVVGVDPGEYLRGADIFVSTSEYESLGLAHLEALDAGVPVVSTARSGPGSFMVQDLSVGYVPGASDPDMIADAILLTISAAATDSYWEIADEVLRSRGPVHSGEMIEGLLQ